MEAGRAWFSTVEWMMTSALTNVLASATLTTDRSNGRLTPCGVLQRPVPFTQADVGLSLCSLWPLWD